MAEKIYIQIGNEKQEAQGEILEQLLNDRNEFEAEQARIQADEQAKESARNSALAKLAALGLTQDEIDAL
jgi:hypothetical protein